MDDPNKCVSLSFYVTIVLKKTLDCRMYKWVSSQRELELVLRKLRGPFHQISKLHYYLLFSINAFTGCTANRSVPKNKIFHGGLQVEFPTEKDLAKQIIVLPMSFANAIQSAMFFSMDDGDWSRAFSVDIRLSSDQAGYYDL